MPLGEYRVVFRDRAGGRTIGSAVLFRLEEYKLPEFRVTLELPEEEGQPRVFRSTIARPRGRCASAPEGIPRRHGRA